VTFDEAKFKCDACQDLTPNPQDYVARASALHDAQLQEHAMKLEKGSGKGVMQIVQIDPTRRS
jgi:hypothetical protein